jgi:hypothetical protein
MKCLEFEFNKFIKKFIDIFCNLEIISEIAHEYKIIND